MSLPGIDIGQSGVKGCAFDEEGKTIANKYTEYNMLFPKEGWVEIDANKILGFHNNL